MPPIEYWFTSTTLTLWIAVLAAIGSLWVAINGDWQASVRDQNRIAEEKAIQTARQTTLAAVLAVSAESDQLAYAPVKEAEYDEWKQESGKFMTAAQGRLMPLLTTAEFAHAFAPTSSSAFWFAHALDDEHNEKMKRLTELATRLRNIALKYA